MLARVGFGGNAEDAVDFRIERPIVLSSNRHGTNSGNQQEIYLTAPNGTGAVRLTTNSTVDTDPVLSPDAEKIAFASNRDGDYDIYVMNVDGTGLVQQLTRNASSDLAPAWSANGQMLAFTSNSGSNGNYDIWRMGYDGSNPTRLTTANGTDTTSSWSPVADGTGSRSLRTETVTKRSGPWT